MIHKLNAMTKNAGDKSVKERAEEINSFYHD